MLERGELLARFRCDARSALLASAMRGLIATLILAAGVWA